MKHNLTSMLNHMSMGTDAIVGLCIYTPHEQLDIVQEIKNLMRMAGASLTVTQRSLEKDAIHEWLLSQLLAMDNAAATRLARHILEGHES